MNPGNDTIAALIAEGDALESMVADLSPTQWALATPATGWTIAHQVAHLAATFRMAGMAASDPQWFTSFAQTLNPDLDVNIAHAIGPYLDGPPGSVLVRWRSERKSAESALAAIAPNQLVPWLVRPIPAFMLMEAGMMELFAHGQDIADALGVRRERSDRLRYVVEFVAATWDFGYQVRGLTAPAHPPRFDVTAPGSGERWVFGPADSTQLITGPAVDLCLLATRRRHRADLALTASGALADQWLDIAQCYRGSAGSGRVPGQFRFTA